MNTQDKQEDQGIFALFKGPSGSGKSAGALSFPTPYEFDFDKKMPNIANKHFPKKSIEYDTFENIFQVSDKINYWLSGQPCQYETLIYDSITFLVSLIFKSVGDVKGESTVQMLKTMQATRSGAKMVELMGIDYYNAETRFMDWIIDANKVLYARPGNPKNVIFTAHILTTESAPDIKTKIVTRTRSIVTAGRKVAATIPAGFDEVWLFGTSEEGLSAESQIKHIMTTQTSGEDDAKTALNIARMTDFTGKSLYDELQKQIQGHELMSF